MKCLEGGSCLNLGVQIHLNFFLLFHGTFWKPQQPVSVLNNLLCSDWIKPFIFWTASVYIKEIILKMHLELLCICLTDWTVSHLFCDPAFNICRKGQLDVRELISLYPLLLPASSSFTRCHPPLHEFADLNHLAQGNQETVLQCKKFLISYLGEVNVIKHHLHWNLQWAHFDWRSLLPSAPRFEAQRWPTAVERTSTLHC